MTTEVTVGPAASAAPTSTAPTSTGYQHVATRG